MSWLDYAILAVLALWLGLSIRWMIHRKKQGKSLSCGGDCAQCQKSCQGRNSR